MPILYDFRVEKDFLQFLSIIGAIQILQNAKFSFFGPYCNGFCTVFSCKTSRNLIKSLTRLLKKYFTLRAIQKLPKALGGGRGLPKIENFEISLKYSS